MSLENQVQDFTSRLESKGEKYEILETKLKHLTLKLHEGMEKSETKFKNQNLVCDNCGFACIRKSEMEKNRNDRHQNVCPMKKCYIM